MNKVYKSLKMQSNLQGDFILPLYRLADAKPAKLFLIFNLEFKSWMI